MVPSTTDWLRHTLLVTGTHQDVAAFRAAAAGPGAIPWRRDAGRLEEEWFLGLAAPPQGARAISLPGARLLARRLRDAVALHEAREQARIAAGDRSCPLDLHRLLPVPRPLLALGPEEPESRDWLWRHWGTSRALRQVHALPVKHDRRLRQTDRWAVAFWSADWSPWPALQQMRRNWPDLSLELTPHYAEE
jgi:hypothetical protein